MNRTKTCLTIGLLGHGASWLFLYLSVEPFETFFYCFAWWTYILFLSAFNQLGGEESALFSRSSGFLEIALFSVFSWLFFEVLNFRLNNWHYIGVPTESVLRWPAYLLAYATVLPGLFETKTLIARIPDFKEFRGPSLRINRRILKCSVLLGAVMMIAAMSCPETFFPLVWIGLICLIDPLLFMSGKGNGSFLEEAEQGKYGLLLQFLIAGLTCGILWEFWNFWAGSKWIYSIPYFDFLRIFEMPVLGFLGFPFFALEAYLLYQAYLASKKRLPRWQTGVRRVLMLILAAAFSGVVVWGIDRWTVASWERMVGVTGGF